MTSEEYIHIYTKSLSKFAWDRRAGIPRAVHPHEHKTLRLPKKWGYIALETFSFQDQEIECFDRIVRDLVRNWLDCGGFTQEREILLETGFLSSEKVVTLKAHNGKQTACISVIMRKEVAFISVRPFELKTKEGREYGG